jgi:hypothetical protein
VPEEPEPELPPPPKHVRLLPTPHADDAEASKLFDPPESREQTR